jgi:hypothetical protein
LGTEHKTTNADGSVTTKYADGSVVTTNIPNADGSTGTAYQYTDGSYGSYANDTSGKLSEYNYTDANGSTTKVNFKPDSTDSTTYQHNALNGVDTVTSQIDGNYFETSFNPATNLFSFSINNGAPYTAVIHSDTGGDILFGGTGTITAMVNGREVVFSVAFNSDNPAEAGGMKLTGIISVDGAVDPSTIAAVNAGIADSGMNIASLAGGGTAQLRQAVAAADLLAQGQEQIVKTQVIPAVAPSVFSKWMHDNGASLTQGMNGISALLRSIDSHSPRDQIQGIVSLSAAISHFYAPKNIGLNTKLGTAGDIVSWVNSYVDLRDAFKSGDGNAIRMAVAGSTVALLNELSKHAANKIVADELKSAADIVGEALAVYSANKAFEQGQYLDAAMDIVALIPEYGTTIKAAYDLSKLGIQYSKTKNDVLAEFLKITLAGVEELFKAATVILTDIFGTPDVWAWGRFDNDANGGLYSVNRGSSKSSAGWGGLSQMQGMMLENLQNTIKQANEQAVKQAAYLGTGAAVELGVLGSRLMYTRFEVTHGNYLRLFKADSSEVNAENGPTFNTDGSRRGDSASSDSFGDNFVAMFVKDASTANEFEWRIAA